MSNPIKPTIKSEIFSILLIAISLAAAFYFYAHFPARVITHWNLAGEPNGWSSPAFAAFFLPLLLIGLYFLFLLLPLIDPKKERYAEFAKAYNIFRNIFILFFVILYFVVSLNNLGYNLDIELWTTGLIGLLFIVLGAYLGKIKPNWFVGIRTPWTLSSETVWNKSHRFGGKVFVLGGILMIIAGLSPLPWRLPIFIADIIILLSGTVVYSYIVYLREKKK
ncbi:MAG TPA: SdpI family protein [Candidatus Nanoarchaeia archaeon]|nr:SdpI family protein [Candidatus Nanoarchaeia archaeon]